MQCNLTQHNPHDTMQCNPHNTTQHTTYLTHFNMLVVTHSLDRMHHCLDVTQPRLWLALPPDLASVATGDICYTPFPPFFPIPPQPKAYHPNPTS